MSKKQKRKERELIKKIKKQNKAYQDIFDSQFGLKMKKLFVVQYDAGMCGTDVAELVIAENEDEAVDFLYDSAVEHYHSYGHLRDDEDEVDEDDYEDIQFDIWAEEYDPDKHDGMLHETEEQINELRKQCIVL